MREPEAPSPQGAPNLPFSPISQTSSPNSCKDPRAKRVPVSQAERSRSVLPGKHSKGRSLSLKGLGMKFPAKGRWRAREKVLQGREHNIASTTFLRTSDRIHSKMTGSSKSNNIMHAETRSDTMKFPTSIRVHAAILVWIPVIWRRWSSRPSRSINGRSAGLLRTSFQNPPMTSEQKPPTNDDELKQHPDLF